MPKYHIGKNGPAICKAKEGNCRLSADGAEAPHFTTKENALNYYNFSNELAYDDNVGKIDTDNLSSQEIQVYLNHIEQELNNSELSQKTKNDLLKAKDNKLNQEKLNNLSQEEKEILDNTHIAFQKDFIYYKNPNSPQYRTFENSPTPIAFIEDIKGPKSIIATHSLVHKFGNKKGLPILSSKDFTKKNLAWIDYYKTNPEDLDKDFNHIKSNMESFNKLWKRDSSGNLKLKSTEIKSNLYSTNLTSENLTTGNKEHNKRIEKLNQLKTKLTEDKNIHTHLEKLSKTSSIKNKSNIDEVAPDKPLEIKDLSTNTKGEINNLYLYNSDKDEMKKISTITGIGEKQYLTTSDGEKIYLYTKYARRKLGKWAMAEEDKLNMELIVTDSPKKSISYTGENKIYKNLFDSTE